MMDTWIRMDEVSPVSETMDDDALNRVLGNTNLHNRNKKISKITNFQYKQHSS